MLVQRGITWDDLLLRKALKLNINIGGVIKKRIREALLILFR